MNKTSDALPLTDRQIVLSRTMNHARERVWSAYTEPEHFARWFGPDGFTVTMKHMDVREGGSTSFVMHAPDGTDFDNYMAYRDVKPVELLAFDHGAHPGDPHSFDVVIHFDVVDAGTKITSQMTFGSVEACERVKGFGAVELGEQTMRKLDEYLQGGDQ